MVITTGINSTPEEKEKFKELNRLRMKLYRDRSRKLKYAPRGKYRLDSRKKVEA
jgi:hypothetical protein